MGEARRKRLAGYVPEPKNEKPPIKMGVIGHVDSGRLGRLALISLLAMYPSLPEQMLRDRGEGGR